MKRYKGDKANPTTYRVEIESEGKEKELGSISGKSVLTIPDRYKEDRELIVALVTRSQLKRQQAQKEWEK